VDDEDLDDLSVIRVLEALEALPQQPLTPAQRMRKQRRKWGLEGKKGFDDGDRGGGQESFVYLYNQIVNRWGQAAADLMIRHRVQPFRLNEALLQIDVDLELWFEATGERVDRPLGAAQCLGLEAWLWERHDRLRDPNRYVPESPPNERPDEEISCRQGKGRPANARQFLSQQMEREDALEADEDQTFDRFCKCETYWLFFEFRVVRMRSRATPDADDSADSNIGDMLAWLWRFQKQNTRAARSTRLGRIRALVLEDGQKRQCLTAWPASDVRVWSRGETEAWRAPRHHSPELRLTGPLSARWRQDGYDFPHAGHGITIARWHELRAERAPRAGAGYLPLRLITKQATRRDNAVDRLRRVFVGYHYVAGCERRWAAVTPDRCPSAWAECYVEMPARALSAKREECRRRREAAIDGLLSSFGCDAAT
jgi:hypothetical protein